MRMQSFSHRGSEDVELFVHTQVITLTFSAATVLSSIAPSCFHELSLPATGTNIFVL